MRVRLVEVVSLTPLIEELLSTFVDIHRHLLLPDHNTKRNAPVTGSALMLTS